MRFEFADVCRSSAKGRLIQARFARLPSGTPVVLHSHGLTGRLTGCAYFLGNAGEFKNGSAPGFPPRAAVIAGLHLYRKVELLCETENG
jgi:hypothetical protein